jgi:hypothetical protein
MAVTINDLRRDWTEQMAAYDKAITLMDNEKSLGIENDGLGKPHREWVNLLHVWRDELKRLLTQYPGTS